MHIKTTLTLMATLKHTQKEKKLNMPFLSFFMHVRKSDISSTYLEDKIAFSACFLFIILLNYISPGLVT